MDLEVNLLVGYFGITIPLDKNLPFSFYLLPDISFCFPPLTLLIYSTSLDLKTERETNRQEQLWVCREAIAKPSRMENELARPLSARAEIVPKH